MKIKLWLPISASAEFEADIDVSGKSDEEILDLFLEECQTNGSLCHHCAREIDTDSEFLYETVQNDKTFFIEELNNQISDDNC